jgi:hypothetical protein
MDDLKHLLLIFWLLVQEIKVFTVDQKPVQRYKVKYQVIYIQSKMEIYLYFKLVMDTQYKLDSSTNLR